MCSCAGTTGGMPDLTYNGYPAVVLEAVRAHDSDEATPAFIG